MTLTKNQEKTLARAARILEKQLRQSDVLSSPDKVRQFLQYRIGGLEHESFMMIILDNRHRVIEVTNLFRGTIDGAAVYPRECVKEVLKYNGAALLLAHNHPSGVSEPSDADVNITRKLIEAMVLIDVRVLDHLVVSHSSITSLAERGLL